MGTQAATTVITTEDVCISAEDTGGSGPVIILLHGLAGSSRELRPTAYALSGSHRVISIDQRGHGSSTRRPENLSREAFVADVIAVIDHLAPNGTVTIVGQSMGAHTAMLTAATRPDLVDRLVMLEGHVDGAHNEREADELGAYFASWPTPFADVDAARSALGDSPIARAWIADLEEVEDGLRPRFDAEVMARTLAAVHEPRWDAWSRVSATTLAVFAERGIFSERQKTELIAARPDTERADLSDASHDAHLDAFDAWIAVLRGFLNGPPGHSSVEFDDAPSESSR